MAVTPTKNVYINWDPGGSDVDVSSYLVGSFGITNQHGEVEITSFADTVKQYAQGDFESSVNMEVQDNDNFTFSQTYWKPAFQGGGGAIAFRQKDAAIATTNPEYQIAFTVNNWDISVTYGSPRRQSYSCKITKVVETTNGSSYTNVVDGSASTAVASL